MVVNFKTSKQQNLVILIQKCYPSNRLGVSHLIWTARHCITVKYLVFSDEMNQEASISPYFLWLEKLIYCYHGQCVQGVMCINISSSSLGTAALLNLNMSVPDCFFFVPASVRRCPRWSQNTFRSGWSRWAVRRLMRRAWRQPGRNLKCGARLR